MCHVDDGCHICSDLKFRERLTTDVRDVVVVTPCRQRSVTFVVWFVRDLSRTRRYDDLLNDVEAVVCVMVIT